MLEFSIFNYVCLFDYEILFDFLFRFFILINIFFSISIYFLQFMKKIKKNEDEIWLCYLLIIKMVLIIYSWR